jgi:hypothetical protein
MVSTPESLLTSPRKQTQKHDCSFYRVVEVLASKAGYLTLRHVEWSYGVTHSYPRYQMRIVSFTLRQHYPVGNTLGFHRVEGFVYPQVDIQRKIRRHALKMRMLIIQRSLYRISQKYPIRARSQVYYPYLMLILDSSRPLFPTRGEGDLEHGKSSQSYIYIYIYIYIYSELMKY